MGFTLAKVSGAHLRDSSIVAKAVMHGEVTLLRAGTLLLVAAGALGMMMMGRESGAMPAVIPAREEESV